MLWTVKQLASTNSALDELFPGDVGPEIVTISTEVPKDALTQSIATAGIIGLCMFAPSFKQSLHYPLYLHCYNSDVGVVLSIGRFLRLYVSNMMGVLYISYLLKCSYQ